MLFCLATYMNEDGNCYPTQDRIAHDLGIRRQRGFADTVEISTLSKILSAEIVWRW
jgi:hypothetical protein